MTDMFEQLFMAILIYSQSFWQKSAKDSIDSMRTDWLLGLDKVSLRLVIDFITEHCEIRSLTDLFQFPTGLLQCMLR